MSDVQQLNQTLRSEELRKKFKKNIQVKQKDLIEEIEFPDVIISPGTDLNQPDVATVISPADKKKIENDAYYAQLLKRCTINILDHYEKPPACIELSQSSKCFTVGTLGNISTVIGKAKSRKTYFLSMVLAAAISDKLIMGTVKVNLPSKRNGVILFDTEQGYFKVHEVTKRIHALAGIEHSEQFTTCALRALTTEDRLNLVEYTINNTPNLGFVVIDGIRDLVTSINDEPQATMINEKLMKWTQEKKIHIMVVIHQNKNDVNARGHLGTELTNKSETVLEISRYPKDKNISVIDGVYCRDQEFDSFAFKIDEVGLPYFIEDHKNKGDGTTKLKPTPEEISVEMHKKILSEVFITEPHLQCGEIEAALRIVCKKNGVDIGESKIGELRQYYVAQGMVTHGRIKGRQYKMYTYPVSL